MTSNTLLLILLISVRIVSAQHIKGLCIAPLRDAVNRHWVNEVKLSGANYIQLSPVAISKYGKPMLFYDKPTQFWNEKSSGVKELIRQANNAGIKVMIKPVVFVIDSMASSKLKLNNRETLKKWQTNYSKYILMWAQMARIENADMLCIGSHLDWIVENDTAYWFALISKIREIYKGKLTYESSLYQAGAIPFWQQLDYIGIDAAYSLAEQSTANVKDLMQKLKPLKATLETLAANNSRPVVFTSWGYRSVDYCTGALQIQPDNYVYNEAANLQCQAAAYAAFLTTFKNEPWHAGGFCRYWKINAGTLPESNSDYSPQNKTAGYVLQKIFKSMH